jgi:hypothetical protein
MRRSYGILSGLSWLIVALPEYGVESVDDDLTVLKITFLRDL